MFAHLHVHSNFSLLDAGSSVEALIDRAKEVGCDSLAVTDHDGLYGAVRFYKYAREAGIKPIIGAEMTLENGHHVVLLAKNLDGYSNLCRIVTRAQLSHEKGRAAASLELLDRCRENLFCLSGCRNGEVAALLLKGKAAAAGEAAARYAELFGGKHFFIEMQNHLLPGTALLNSQLYSLAEKLKLGVVATNNLHYARKEDFKVQDVLTCVLTLTTVDERSPLRKQNCEYYLKSPQAMARLFIDYPKALAATAKIAAQCNLDLGFGTYRFPGFPVPEGETAYSYLCKLCFEGLSRLYKPITRKATKRLRHELSIIHDLGFAEYFLVVWDIVRYARGQGIRCSGRGSAADSMVAYCLGITIVDPVEHDLLFERFLNPERKGMPDIDIDFDAARRDEVIDYIYKRCGEDKVAMVCTVSTLCAKSSVRDIGKAMNFPPEEIDRLASALPHTGAKRIREAVEKLPELRNGGISLSKMDALVDICEKVDGFPRHLSVHLGGLVISRGLLTDLVPLEWATKGVIVSQFDKDDIEALGLVKIDILGLRNLSAIEDALAMIKENHGIELDIDNLPLDDPKVYEMLRSTKTVGLFQVESPGMRGLLGRLQPTRFDDLTANIALFRPGPMQADMINPFIKRRHGEEPEVYLHPKLKPILKETYGVVLYQEQVLRISSALAGFTPGQADSLRRAMTTDRSQDEMEKIKDTFIQCAVKNGVEQGIAEKVFSQLRAFAAYGFCKAHAASFAKIAYQTAYLKAHYPAEFLAGILCNEPMGFYPANVVLEEARRLGIGILGVDVNRSRKKFSVEDGKIRIGLMQVKGISDAEIESILEARKTQEFSSFSDFCLRTRIDRPVIENLINCGAFDRFGHSRGKLLWLLGEVLHVRGQSPIRNPQLFEGLSATDLDEQVACLPDVPEPPPHIRVRMDYEILGISPLCHPMVFYRQTLMKMGAVRSSRLGEMPSHAVVKVAGVVVTCMRPPTRSGVIVVFVTLEDETGLVDTVIFPKVYEKYGPVIFNSPGLIIEGKIERSGQRGISVIARKVWPLTTDHRNEGLSADPYRYPERKHSAGQRSWVKGQGM
ncbi:MAG TPA: DNA polymerase III subunit alpha [Armatimonadota bacterium]|nr:DNA polymerase III subunit alpha [Armatimonadota bacterium]